MNHHLELLLSKEEIQILVEDLARRIDKDCEGEESILLVGLLKGSVIFLADLARAIQTPAAFDFMVVSSYQDGIYSSRDVKILKDLDENIHGQAVILVEDIVDTGYTLEKILEILKTRHPKSLRVCSLLDKPNQREIAVPVDYVGKILDQEFVVGYGMDFAQKYRTLPDVHVVVFEEEEA